LQGPIRRRSNVERILREVLTECERTLGPEYPDTLATRLNLATALSREGKDAEAETEFRAALKLEEKVLGPEHPSNLGTCFNLALCLRSQGRSSNTRSSRPAGS
jgi:hypothetical protein